MALTLVCATTPASSALATSVALGGDRRARVALRSFRELRDQNVVRQRTDYSCGAAALATLLRFGFGERVSETDILGQMLETLSQDQERLRKKEGFSLLDLQKVAEQRGYRAQGFRIEPRYLERVRGPVIVFVEPAGYGHFSVLKGMAADRVFLADPSLGNVRMPLYRFLDMWVRDDRAGIVFAIEPVGGGSAMGPLGSALEDPGWPEVLAVRELRLIGSRDLRLRPEPR